MAEGKQPVLNQVSDFELKLLKVFRTVAACGGFSAAEVSLGISRAAISMQMADLESRLGFKLCQRGRAGFALTDEGRRVLEASDRLVGAIDHFKAEINDLHQHLRGTLAIGITDNLVSHPGMKITHGLAALKARGPEVKIHIHMQPSDDIEIGVLDGRLNIGVVPRVRELPGLDYLPLYEESSSLYCASGHPLFADDEILIAAGKESRKLTDFELVVPSFAQPTEAQALYRRHPLGARANDREGIMFLLLTGCYLGYLPDHYARPWVERGRLRALQPNSIGFTTRFCAITARSRRANLVLDTFLETLSPPSSSG
ncbi:LysR family transcriptional regulator [Oceanisphaera arctica]|uniref:LysR family transcriptional regulator n=1 Tax=Oceanisphaera arctica TaxID=641510 RepID=A0A2P5THV1_9GAMM|nr:LysR family transcriptional regulator [Oceanisphaera arctica]PPL14114.1 LysR family transcriptional regulator [Oceanisphaera arctica]GHA26091.1 LysR family transcriptional regulator [Oceanisphaera arctica]